MKYILIAVMLALSGCATFKDVADYRDKQRERCECACNGIGHIVK